MSNFRQVDRRTGFLLPPSIDEWLPERHLARFVVEVIEQLDLSAMVKAYRGSGSASYHPSVLLGLLIYGYATAVFSSRKIERATYDSVAFRFIAANDHPDHDTIAAFRRRFLAAIEALFVQVLLLAREAGLVKLGTVALDGTKVHANASRHSALSHEHVSRIEAQLKAEVAALLALAEAADAGSRPEGPGQSDRRGLAHHAGRGRRLRAGLQRPGGGGDRQPPGGGHRCRPGRQRQGAGPADAGPARPAARGAGQARDPARGQRLLQPGERAGVRRSQDRALDRPRTRASSSLLEGALRRRAAGPGEPDPAGRDGASPGDARRPANLRPAQADAGTGVRHHQGGDGLPPVLPARPRQGQRRVAPGDPGLEPEADVRPQPCLTTKAGNPLPS